MQWFSENWIFVVVVVGMVAMHLFGHGGHGGHGGHDRRGDTRGRNSNPPNPTRGGHRH